MTEEQGRDGQVLEVVVALFDALLDDFDVLELLTRVTERCVDLLGIASAGLLIADPGRQLHLVAATSERTRVLELFQLQCDEGPCLDCFATGTAVSVADLREHATRWQHFVPAALEAGFASLHAIPLRAGGGVLGTLGLFGNQAGGLEDADVIIGKTMARLATAAVLQDGPPTQAAVLRRLQDAVVSRVLLEQAKGFLSERLNVSMEHAALSLRSYSNNRGLHVTDVARRIVRDTEGREQIISDLGT